MKSASLASPRHLAAIPKPRRLESLARRAVLGRLEQLSQGELLIRENGGKTRVGSPGEFDITLSVNDPGFWTDIAFGGSIGAGEAWMRGAWDCDDPVALVRLLVRNEAVLDAMEGGTAWLTRPLQWAWHRFNRNTREGARRNISAHYDLGNDFFALWLDESLMYSSAIFESPGMSLHDAQVARLETVCRKLGLGPDDHVVEIGTGWGGFALHAAGRYGCRVTTTTISGKQYEMARERVRLAGLQDRVTVLQKDYRDLCGRFDHLVSIEMIEAIGWRQYPEYFRQCGRLLRPGGRMLIQAITIAEPRYEQARNSVDFIQRYIFPGSNLPSVSAMTQAIAAESDLMVTGLEDIGLHYATTLNHWRRNFHQCLDQVRALGYPPQFIRMWDWYLAYCEGGFLERAISDVHLVAERPPFAPA
jgi:cyclopropane-fatty-acyl-phospholipid synthase